jgi:small subunit ribosomal protein S17e
MIVLENNRKNFGVDFEENKKSLNNISTITSKSLKNQIAGYITRFIKKEIQLESEKEELIENQEQPTEETAPTEEKSKDEPVVEETPAEEVQD